MSLLERLQRVLRCKVRDAEPVAVTNSFCCYAAADANKPSAFLFVVIVGMPHRKNMTITSIYKFTFYSLSYAVCYF